MEGALPVFLTLLLGQQGAPQPAAAGQQPVFPSGVEIVAIDVSVVDENGRPVRDLRPEDFEVRLNKKPRKVVSAEFMSHTGEAPEQPAGPVPTHYSTNEGFVQGRLILLAVDEANISAGDGAHAVRAAAKLLDRVGPADRVGFLTIPGPHPREEFTTDHARIRAALGKVVGQGRFQGRRLSLSESLSFVENEDPQRWRDVVTRLCRGDQACPEELENEARQVAAEYQAQSVRSLGVLRAAFEAFKAIDGPKVVVLVTQGLGLPGAGTRGGATAELQQLTAAARAARVSFFVVLIDPPLVSAATDGQISAQQLMEDRDLHARALDYLADGARGSVLRGMPENAFERIAREISGHYQLGFEPEERDRDGKDHDVSVKLRRPRLTVRVGRDVMVPKPGTQRDERALLVALLRSPTMATELSLRTATWTIKDMASGKLRVMIETETAAGRAPAAASVAYLMLDDKGKAAATALQTRTPQDGTGAESGGAALVVTPGQYTLRVAARDGRGRSGSVSHPVAAALQEAEGVQLSDLLLGPAPDAGRSFRPALDTAIALPNGILGCHLELYAAQAAQFEPLSVWIDIVRADKAAVVKTRRAQLGTTPQEGRRVAQATIAVAGLEPGSYVARAKVVAGERELGEVARPFRVTTP